MAIGPFKDAFEAKYVKPDSSDPKDVAFAAAVMEAQCNVCHVGANKKDRNGYGRALADLLDRQEDRDAQEKIRTALDHAASLKSVPDDANSLTFGQLIEEGKLPGGTAE
jgi:cytochrome c2